MLYSNPVRIATHFTTRSAFVLILLFQLLDHLLQQFFLLSYCSLKEAGLALTLHQSEVSLVVGGECGA